MAFPEQDPIEKLAFAIDDLAVKLAGLSGFVAALPNAASVDRAQAKGIARSLVPASVRKLGPHDVRDPASLVGLEIDRLYAVALQIQSDLKRPSSS